MAEIHGAKQPKVAQKLASIVSQLQQLKVQLSEGEKEDPLKYVPAENRPKSREEKDKALERQGVSDGRAGAKRKNYAAYGGEDGKRAQAKYDAGYNKGKATKPRYA
jgi:hypothetical protein